MHKISTAILVGLLALGCLSNKTQSNQAQSDSKLGEFSVSLAVKDIAASKAFYENLGFTQLEGAGGIAQKWMIMKSGTSKIGLFQDLFPNNTLTFNPSNARPIHKALVEKGTTMVYEMGLEKESGPCSFSFLDPDGNPILVDQHNP